MMPRPDELANQAEIERDTRIRGGIRKGIGAAGALAAGGLSGRLMPFLNEYIPTDLAMKGINKIAPQVGAFLKKGQKMGLDLQEGLNFVKDKLSPKEDTKAIGTNTNPIQKHSPELHQFLLGQIKNGKKPLEAAALVSLPGKVNDKFKSTIKKIVNEYKTDWHSLVESIYGTEALANPESKAALQQSSPSQQNPNMGSPSQQPGAGKEKFLDMLDRLSQQLGPNQ